MIVFIIFGYALSKNFKYPDKSKNPEQYHRYAGVKVGGICFGEKFGEGECQSDICSIGILVAKMGFKHHVAVDPAAFDVIMLQKHLQSHLGAIQNLTGLNFGDQSPQFHISVSEIG